jgi:hypothetical protein
MPHQSNRIALNPGSVLLIVFCIAIVLWSAAYPFGRVFLLTPFDYNEGWNVFNAQKAAEHKLLYPAGATWSFVNYPALSFHLVAALGRFTKGFLFAGRLLSLAGLCLSGILSGMIVWQATRRKMAAYLTWLFVIAMFCANDTYYVGMDDPQMLAQAFFLAGIYVYLRGDQKARSLDLTALLFVVGGNIKHNLIEFPLAVLFDLLLTSPRRALRFAVGGLLMTILSVALTIYFDGPGYVASLLSPRSYLASQVFAGVGQSLLTTLLPTAAALWMVPRCWNDARQRVLVLLFLFAVAVDTYFSGGEGVDINIFFGYTLAVALLTGVFWAQMPELPAQALRTNATYLSFFAFLLMVPIFRKDAWPGRDLAKDRAGAQRFATEVAFLRRHPGPAVCEELLECYYAGKSYLYDPFNAMRLVERGRLDPGVMVNQVKSGRYAAVQMYSEPEQLANGEESGGFFPSPVLKAIVADYKIGLENEDGVIYVPKRDVTGPLR